MCSPFVLATLGKEPFDSVSVGLVLRHENAIRVARGRRRSSRQDGNYREMQARAYRRDGGVLPSWLLLISLAGSASRAQEIPKSVPDYHADKKVTPDWGFGQGPGTYDLERSEEFTVDRTGRPECDAQTEALYRDCLGTDTKLRGALIGREVTLKSAGKGRKLELRSSTKCADVFKAYAQKCVFEEFDNRL